MIEKKEHEHEYVITSIFLPDPTAGWDGYAIAQMNCKVDNCSDTRFVELKEHTVD